MNKSLLVNLIAAALTAIGYFADQAIVFSVGLFALSGAFTNWLAVHMLFEKVPGLYGSGVIEARFNEFKKAIENLMMEQFFNHENIDKFLSDQQGHASHFNFAPIIEKVDFEPAYDSLVNTINESKFGSMLAMFGGESVIEPLKQPFISKLKQKIIEISESDTFNELVRESVEQPDVVAQLREKVKQIVIARLDELTPKMVKTLVQDMIKHHLGWLVVWGGFFGGLFGLAAAFV
ncbi:DUF445 domain-containing protein [Catenovulum sp. 2E275]|uniref:DUF445 domain-containing protein n=1 Tax=Catenovulum sp. 2E275 TaxID=2980497 RepID=UPI0021D371FE|nr:DUF445 domain-containing protein [Catenovulum sp. 2E275]MCU4677420.1 DUF445 domain-containing protein [Catenovulum sp. 2E275]